MDNQRCNLLKKTIYCRKSKSSFCLQASSFEKYHIFSTRYPRIESRNVQTFFTLKQRQAGQYGCKNQAKGVEYEDNTYCILFESDPNQNVSIACNPHIDDAKYAKLNVYLMLM
ncbi:hypothetical protein RF11_15797 [Thelohanellus kitauei]|uniref:Uncharacterized protein n=1 Tax=Thelohanellus kitauei TaxID=669202 RepID=A0A0C2IKN4_THEKT|nr:hypothetical protein RF11_15797 [Thelohanellus kitauei]